MTRLFAAFAALLQLLLPALPAQDLPGRLRSGQWLRFHVIAHDDSQEMQQLKLTVRDAVQACYASLPTGADMLADAALHLPQLTDAARQAATEAGFPGPVEVTLGMQAFDARTLGGVTVPAGTYPALVIRLGDARGQNWWGLLDPETSLEMAVIGSTGGDAILWDWSWQALLTALFGWVLPSGA